MSHIPLSIQPTRERALLVEPEFGKRVLNYLDSLTLEGISAKTILDGRHFTLVGFEALPPNVSADGYNYMAYSLGNPYSNYNGLVFQFGPCGSNKPREYINGTEFNSSCLRIVHLITPVTLTNIPLNQYLLGKVAEVADALGVRKS
jgi:hypothetical protein